MTECCHCGYAIAEGYEHLPDRYFGVNCFRVLKAPPVKPSPEPTRLELIAALQCAESILWMAGNYSHRTGLVPKNRMASTAEKYQDAADTIRAILARCPVEKE